MFCSTLERKPSGFKNVFIIIAIGALMPYIPLYFKTLGFTPTEMSLIIAAMPISSAIFIPIVTTIADKWNCHRLALAVVALVSAGRLRASHTLFHV